MLFVGKAFAGKSSYDADSTSTTVAASEKVLVPGRESGGSSSSVDLVSRVEPASGDLQVCVASEYGLWLLSLISSYVL